MRISLTKKWQYGGLAALAATTIAVSAIALAPEPGLVPVALSAPESSGTQAGTPETPTSVTAKRNTGPSLRTLFAGDSLTGALYASEQVKGFKWLMLDKLEQTGPIEEFNSAISGGTTLDVSAKYEVPAELDLAVVELGTNDLGNATPLSDFSTAYDSLLDRITNGSPGVALVCAGVWEGGGGGPEGPAYDRVVANLCDEHGGVFVSLRKLYQNPATIGPAGVPAFTGNSDMFHPNDAGHRAIADALLERIKVA